MSLDYQERVAVADRFGVADAQVERDYLISLLLAHIGARHADAVIFIGGTALARTHLPNGRLSEDIDLIAVGHRNEIAADLTRTLPRAVARRYGRLEWNPSLTDVSGSAAAYLATPAGRIGVKIQLLSKLGMTLWPTEPRNLVQRYRDAPAAVLHVPTRPAFVAAKTVAWCDRAAARDLWDLWALAQLGAIDRDAAELFRQHGPINKPPRQGQFTTAPTESQWKAQLSGQTRLDISAVDALRVVREAWLSAAP